MKTFLCLFLLFPVFVSAQSPPGAEKDITGLWKGTVITPELVLPYELVITRQKGKLTGYSHTTFTVRGEEIVSVKKVLIRFKDDEIIVEDEDMLFNNFFEEAPKKIKQTNKFTLDESADTWRLHGTFEAKAPRMLKPANGTVELVKKNSPEDTKLIAKLEQLELSNTISFNFNQQANQPIATTKAIPAPALPPVTDKTAATKTRDSSAIVSNVNATPSRTPAETLAPVPTAKPAEPDLAAFPTLMLVVRSPKIVSYTPSPVRKPGYQPVPIKTTARIAREEIPVAVVTAPVVKAPPIARVEKPAVKQTTAPATQRPAATVSNNKPPVPAINKPVQVSTSATTAVLPKPPAALPPRPVNVVVAPAIDLGKRKIETIEQLIIESDSLQFTLYDNGEVDGDTVSIILNGKTIVLRQGLNTTAFTKTVYMTPDLGDTVQLVMYAENLGSLPPNTGLLVLLYDNKRQEIRFSGDLSKNAAITLRRKPKN